MALDEYKIAAQFIRYDDCWTDTLKRWLCREFNLISSVDPDGSERVARIPTTEPELSTPDETITFADIRAADSQIIIEEPDPMHIYPEPFVRYNIDAASGEPLSIIKIKNVTAGTFDTSYVEAPADASLGESEAKELWDRCVDLHSWCGLIKQPPAELTDLKLANGGEQAHEIAKNYLSTWINRMRWKHITFRVHLLCTAGGGSATPVRQWQEGQRFRITLPHETNDVTVECIADRIAIDTGEPYHIEVGAYLLETEKLPEAYFIKKSYDANYDNWKKTYFASDTQLQKVF
jgi:hypothetical protein